VQKIKDAMFGTSGYDVSITSQILRKRMKQLLPVADDGKLINKEKLACNFFRID